MKNDYEIRGEITAIFLNNNLETLISTSDLEKVKKFPNTWYAWEDKKNQTFYVMGNLPRNGGEHQKIRLHRWLLDSPKGLVIDHINHNTLDNRKENLRAITNAQNCQNKKGVNRYNKSSGIRGVSWHINHKVWQVYLTVNGKKLYIGSFKDIKEAEKQAIDARRKFMPFSTT